MKSQPAPFARTATSQNGEVPMVKERVNRNVRPSMRLARLVRALVVVVSVAGVLIAARAMPAAAAGGGCSQSPTHSGWQIAVCSSDDGIRVFGNIYINRQGSGVGSCQVEYRLWDVYNVEPVGFWSSYQSCNLGIHPAIYADKKPGIAYRNIAILHINGTPLFSWSSKLTT